MNGITFLTPLFLVGIPLTLSALLYIYKHQTSKNARVVSTIFFLKDFIRPSFERVRTKLPPRFFIEAILFLLLVLALSDITFSDRKLYGALIIDGSLSTQAIGTDGLPLVSEINAVALSMGKGSGSTSFDIYNAKDLKPIRENVSLEAENIPSLKSDLYTDKLLTVINSVSKKGYDTIVVVTDKKLSGTTPSPIYTIQSVESFLRNTGNIAIQKVSLLPQNDGVKVYVRSFSETACSGTISVAGKKEGFSVDAGQSEQVIVKAPIVTEQTVVTLEAGDRCQNALKEDDVTYLLSRKPITKNFLVAGTQSLDELGLKDIHDYTFEVAKLPEEERGEQRNTDDVGGAGRPRIFYRTTPEKLPEGPALFVIPEERSYIVPQGVSRDLQTTRWDKQHPLTTYLHLDLFSAAQAETFRLLRWQKPIISSQEGPILLSAESNGVRYVFTGFDLFPFRAKESPVMSILTLNILKWLTESDSPKNENERFSEAESNLASNTLDRSSLPMPASPKSRGEQGSVLKTVLSYGALLFCILDLVHRIMFGRLIGEKK